MALSTDDLNQLETNIDAANTWVNGDKNTDAIASNGDSIKSIQKINKEAKQSFDQHLATLGFEPPIAFASSILVDRTTLTVEYLTNVYAPLASVIPFTTTASFVSAEWYLITDNVPAQSGNQGKTLTTDGTTLSWTDKNPLTYPTLALGLADGARWQVGMYIDLEERTAGNGGGGRWKVIASTTNNGFNIVDVPLNAAISLSLVISERITSSQLGGTSTGDQLAILDKLAELAYLNGVWGIVDDYAHTVSASWVLENDGLAIWFLGNARIVPSSNTVLSGITIGGVTTPSRMYIYRPKVDRTTYDGATENVGITYLEMTQCSVIDAESRFSKYNHHWNPTSGGNAHNKYDNLQGIGGFYNFWLEGQGATSYTNENQFNCGRGFCTSDTDTNLRISTGSTKIPSGNHFNDISLEGQGVQGVYDDGDSNTFKDCRSEGTWSSGYFHVLGPNCTRSVVMSSRLDYTFNSKQATTPRLTKISYRTGSELFTANNLLTTLRLENTSTSRGTGLEIYNTRQNADAFAWQAWRKISSASGTHDGAANAAILTDSGESWTINAFVDARIENTTDGSWGIVTANTATTITATLADGTDNDWDVGDAYVVYLSNGYLNTLGILHARQKLKVGSSNPAYTVTNGLTDRTYDANTVTIAELADVVGTIISDLKGKGLFD